MAKNLEELKAENPELANALMGEAKAAAVAEAGDKESAAIADERKRLQEIDEISHLFDAETVKEAKYGDKPRTAQEMTFRAAQKAAQEGKSFLSDLADDAKKSGAQNVGASPGGEETVPLPDIVAEAKRAAGIYKKSRGIGGAKDE
jgi:hypothetical protein